MITAERQYGGATYRTFGASIDLLAGEPRAQSLNATAANCDVRLPDATRVSRYLPRLPGAPQFRLFNLGANAINITTYNSTAQYPATFTIKFTAATINSGQMSVVMSGTEGGSSWSGTAAGSVQSATFAMNVSGAKPHFTLVITKADTTTISFTLDWDGIHTASSIVHVSGAACTIDNVGLGNRVLIGTLGVGKVALVGLTASVNNISAPCSGTSGWRMHQWTIGSTRAASRDRTGRIDPCTLVTVPPPPPPPKWKCVDGGCILDPTGPYDSLAECIAFCESPPDGYRLQDCFGVKQNMFVDKNLFVPGNHVILGNNLCYVVLSETGIKNTKATLIPDCGDPKCLKPGSCADVDPLGAGLPSTLFVSGGSGAWGFPCTTHCLDADFYGPDTPWDQLMALTPSSTFYQNSQATPAPGSPGVSYKGKRFGVCQIYFSGDVTMGGSFFSPKDDDINTSPYHCAWFMVIGCYNGLHDGGDTSVWWKPELTTIRTPKGTYHRYFSEKFTNPPGCYTWDTMSVS